MIVNCVTVYVKEGRAEDFIRATVENHKGSVLEPGNLRFDVLRCKEDPNRFLLYEAYASEEAAAAHKKTAHYLKWRDEVAELMAKPREGIAYQVVAPTERGQW